MCLIWGLISYYFVKTAAAVLYRISFKMAIKLVNVGSVSTCGFYVASFWFLWRSRGILLEAVWTWISGQTQAAATVFNLLELNKNYFNSKFKYLKRNAYLKDVVDIFLLITVHSWIQIDRIWRIDFLSFGDRHKFLFLVLTLFVMAWHEESDKN